MPEDMQPSLFPQPGQTEAEVIDISAAARHIAEHAGRPELPDRTSDAARYDQGHGPVQISSTEHIPASDAERAQARARRTHPAASGAKVYELPGKNGRRNTPGVATRAEAQKGLTPEEIDRRRRVNSTGAAVARAALKGASQQ